jgi:hypothetical protein
VDERAQAQLLSRCYMGAVASGAVQNMGWYDFRNDGNDPFYNEFNFGVLRQDMSPKPAYRALATVCRSFAAGKPAAAAVEGDGVLGLQMGDALALWSPSGDREAELWFRHAPEAVLNLMGEPLDVSREASRMGVRLRAGSPVFFTGAEPQRIRARAVETADNAGGKPAK